MPQPQQHLIAITHTPHLSPVSAHKETNSGDEPLLLSPSGSSSISSSHRHLVKKQARLNPAAAPAAMFPLPDSQRVHNNKPQLRTTTTNENKSSQPALSTRVSQQEAPQSGYGSMQSTPLMSSAHRGRLPPCSHSTAPAAAFWWPVVAIRGCTVWWVCQADQCRRSLPHLQRATLMNDGVYCMMVCVDNGGPHSVQLCQHECQPRDNAGVCVQGMCVAPRSVGVPINLLSCRRSRHTPSLSCHSLFVPTDPTPKYQAVSNPGI